MREESTDVVLVGAGPIGIEMAVGLKRAGVEYLHLDARQIGYTVSWFAPQTRFFSSNERIAIAGVPLETPDQGKASREQYLAYLRSVVRLFDLAIHTYEPVVGVTGREGEFFVTTRPRSGERRVRARRIIFATGGTDRPRRLDVPGEDLPHVSHYFRDPHDYFGQRVLIVGGKNSAVEAALRCHHAGARVTLSYRRPELDARHIKYWLMPEIATLLKSGKMAGLFGTTPTRITPTQVTLREVVRPDHSEDADLGERQVEADFVLLLIGYEADPTLLQWAGVTLDGVCHAPRFDPRTMQTNVPGVYVIGTATGGTQDKYSIFIENCHIHVDRVVAALTGGEVPMTPVANERLES